MKIRRVLEKDKNEWLRLRKLLWPHHSLKSHLSEMKEYYKDKSKFAIFVAVHFNGKLEGFVEASIHPFAFGCDTKPVGYLEGLYVDPDLRLKGISRQLVRKAEAWASSKGCREMASDCLIDNKVSLKTHLALGYKETERLIHFKKLLKSSNFI